MFNVPTWFLFSLIAAEVLILVGPFLLAGAVVILAVPSWRERRGLRRAARWALAACLALLVCGLPAGAALLNN